MVYLFVIPWVILGLVILVFAISGGPAGARERVLHSQSTTGRKLTGAVLAVLFVAGGVAVPTLVVAQNQDNDEAGRARVELSESARNGRELFGQRCQQCHTLAAANAVGRTGPNLDELKPKYEFTLNVILNGKATGIGTMPAQIVSGEDAEDVARFVAKVAGTQ